MSTQTTVPTEKKFRPYVPETMEMKEFTLRALLIGLVMTAILGSANAYLGLKAGMTIAATYPAAVIGMALLRLMKGSLLEENIARTVGSNRWPRARCSPFPPSSWRGCGRVLHETSTGNRSH
jgi:OPT oligopeptide transporter protein